MNENFHKNRFEKALLLRMRCFSGLLLNANLSVKDKAGQTAKLEGFFFPFNLQNSIKNLAH